LVDRLSREGFNSVDWTDSQLAPDRNEIRFTGILRGKQTRQSGKLTETGFVPEKYEEHKVETSCVVRVARVNGTNQWRVDYVYVKERE
jgi:hypothetical protein